MGKKLSENQNELNKTINSITFSGNGEPTIHPKILGIVNDVMELRDRYCPQAKISILSNSTNLVREDVFEALRKIDNPILKLDAGTEDMYETINKQVRATRQLLQKLGREPSPEEIAEQVGYSVERVREIQKIAQDPVSLETPIGEEEDSHLGDFIEDNSALSPAEVAESNMLKEQLIAVLNTLTPREEKVLRLRYGFDDSHPRTLEEVGKEFNVTRERIRQIEAKALRKMKHPNRIKKLKDFS